jgi:hypothetical protein
MLDDRFDDQLREAAHDYNAPPETPRDQMWEKIVAARTADQADRETDERKDETIYSLTDRSARAPIRLSTRLTVRTLRWPVGIAALLALGIGLGRMTAPGPDSPAPTTVVTEAAPRGSEVAYRLAATEHLSQSETFLTLFRASVRQGGNEQLASSTARQLLATNRLLLDSPAAADNRTRLLLQDLELVLAQIAQLSGRPSSPDLDLITNGLDDSGVMSRLRTAVPSGTSATQGVL